MDVEVWTTPNGVSVELHPAEFPPPPVDTPDDDMGDWEWFPESPGHRPPRRYLLVEVGTGVVVDEHVVHPVDPWSPYDAISDRLLRDGYEPPPLTEAEMALCEHGMSANLCVGPSHYPMDM